MRVDLSEHVTMDNNAIDGHISSIKTAPTYTTEVTLLKIAEPLRKTTSFVGNRRFQIDEEEDGTIAVQAVSEDHNQNQIVTVRTKKLRTPSNASEELRNTIVEKTKMSPGGTLMVEKDVVTTRKRLTARGSNYYTRSAYTTRTRVDKGGSETVEHSVCVETDNKSVSQGHSWGDKAVAKITLEDAENADLIPPPGVAHPGPVYLHGQPITDEKITNNLQSIPWNDSFETNSECILVLDTGKNGHIENETIHRHKEYEALGPQLKNVPVFEKVLDDITVTEGHSTILSCLISEAVSVEWHKNGTLQKNSADFKQTFDGHEARLEIGELTLDDFGEYTCVAKNDAGEQRSTCTLNVNECDLETTVVPMFLNKLPNRTLSYGETLTLECDVIGSPEPSISWLKDGKAFRPNLAFSTCYDGRVAILQVFAMRTEDSGRYICQAENPAGKVSMDANVTVQVKNKGPQFISKLEDVRLVSSHNIVLKCEVTGIPAPSVTWKKDGCLVITSHNLIQSNNSGVARLEILAASSKDSGHYECLAQNVVSETSCGCLVEVADPKVQPTETTAPKDEQIIKIMPKVTKMRVFKKLSEPRPADIISAVLQRASSHGVHRAHTFSPNSSTITRENFQTSRRRADESRQPDSSLSHPETVSVFRESIIVTPRSGSSLGHSHANSSSIQGVVDSTASSDRHTGSVISRTASLKLTEQSHYPTSNLSHITSLNRSASMNTVKTNNFVPVKPETVSSGGSQAVWSSSKRDIIDSREVMTVPVSKEVTTDLRPSSPIPGYRPVSPMLFNSLEKNKLAPSPLTKYSNNGSSESPTETHRPEKAVRKEREHVPLSIAVPATSSITSSRHPPTSGVKDRYIIPTTSSSSSYVSSSASTLTERFAVDVSSEPRQQTSYVKAQAPSVSSLRQQFLKNDQLATESLQKKPLGNSVGGVRRWHSLPPQENKPTIIQRKSVFNTIMPSYQEMDNEEELHKMMNDTQDFEERKKIRTRLREIRDKQRDEMDAKRKQREAEAEDLVKKKFERAEEEKRKKMEAYKHQAPTHERDSKYHEVSQNLIQDKFKAAEEEKAKKLAAYSNMATKTGPSSHTATTTTTTTEKTPEGGTRTVTQKTSETKGFGGTSYGKPAEVTAQELTARLMRSSGPGVIGRITVRTEAWNSTDGLVEKSEKSHSWGAKPQGARGAMAAFKQMDNISNPDAAAAKPNQNLDNGDEDSGLITVSLAKKAASNMKRNVVAIKQEILNFCKQNVAEYEEVEVTNFSSSWNNGMAFCALIHHFFPNAFDFSKLDPKQRRYNFTLAFDTAEKEADIAPLLDVDDMVKMKNPDWKCVFTYVQSIYRHLKDHENNKAGPIEQ